MIRTDQLISGFLKRQYGVSMSLISSKLRSSLLEDTEQVACGLCGSTEAVEVGHRDKFDLPVTSVMCRHCGLLYLNPRPTKGSYDRFYVEGGSREGVYHVSLGLTDIENLMRRYWGDDFRMSEAERKQLTKFVREQYSRHVKRDPAGLAEQDLLRALESKAKEFEAWEYDAYAADIYRYFREFVPRGGKVFEAGAAWGKLLVPWRDLHGCEVTGVEPRARTVQTAKERLGITLYHGFPATAGIPEDTFDAVQNIRTINHMIDPLGDLRHAWRWLKPGGVLIVDIADALCEARYEGFETNVVEIDHPYMFSIDTLAAMVQKAGFEIVKREIVDIRHVFGRDREPEYKQIRIVGRKSVQPVEVALADPLQQMAALAQAQLVRERTLLEGPRGKKRSATAKKAKAPRGRSQVLRGKAGRLWSRLTGSP
jgi:SAM-dependent methyltransferase/RNase P subunit RPR2